MPRDYKQQLDDIVQAAGFIREYVKGMDYEAFAADFLLPFKSLVNKTSLSNEFLT